MTKAEPYIQSIKLNIPEQVWLVRGKKGIDASSS